MLMMKNQTRSTLLTGFSEIFYQRNQSNSKLLQSNISWVVDPESGCSEEIKLLLMISSGPRNVKQRNIWRRRVESIEDLRPVFLVSQPVTEDSDDVQNMINHESHQFGDIIQPR